VAVETQGVPVVVAVAVLAVTVPQSKEKILGDYLPQKIRLLPQLEPLM